MTPAFASMVFCQPSAPLSACAIAFSCSTTFAFTFPIWLFWSESLVWIAVSLTSMMSYRFLLSLSASRRSSTWTQWPAHPG